MAIETHYVIFTVYIVVLQVYKNVCIRLPLSIFSFITTYVKCFQSRRSFTVTRTRTSYCTVLLVKMSRKLLYSNQKVTKDGTWLRSVSRKRKFIGNQCIIYEHSTAITSTENLFKRKIYRYCY